MVYEITDLTAETKYPAKEEESLFRAMIRSGKGCIRYGCEGGGCGVCKIRITEGEYERFKNMSRAHVSEDEEKEGIVLACCVKPKSDITLAKFKTT